MDAVRVLCQTGGIRGYLKTIFTAVTEKGASREHNGCSGRRNMAQCTIGSDSRTSTSDSSEIAMKGESDDGENFI